jgi:serine/threonine protein kinase
MPAVAPKAVQKVGDYVILEQISRGAMGTVFKGRRPSTGGLVAIKLVSAEVVADEELRLRFAQECQVARLLNHPNVVGVLDFGLDGSRPYLVMEYVEGESLRQRLERQGPLPEAEAVSLIRQVGQALHWAHEKKLVHRDVKPGNILVNASGQAKLTDLGLAKNLETNLGLTRTNTFFGTPHFMAPEQFLDAKRADAQSDLYSLAATLYMLLTGQLPFETPEGIVAVYQKKLANDIEPPVRLVPGLSGAVNAAILGSLRAERKERPRSVLEFIDALTREGTGAPMAPVRANTSPGHGIPSAEGALTNNPAKAAVAPPLALRARHSEGAAAPHAENKPCGLRRWLTFAAPLLPGVLGTGLAASFVPHHNERALLALALGWGLTVLLLLFLVRPKSA